MHGVPLGNLLTTVDPECQTVCIDIE
jgi:hypothetical protein